MPLFEYRCKECEHLEEVLQKHGEPPPEACPACGAQRSLEKEISLTSFQLKGGGWYKDLYSSTPAKTDSGSSSSASGGASSASSAGGSSSGSSSEGGSSSASSGGEKKTESKKSDKAA